MELNVEKILELKKIYKYTWADMAEKGGAPGRQYAHARCKKEALKSADFWAKVFDMDKKDFIK